MTRYWIPVHGTHGEHDAWRQPGSPFCRFLARHGLLLFAPDNLFEWTGDLDGVPFDRGRDWKAGDKALRYYLETVPYEHRNLVAHSHGGPVVLGCAEHVPIRSLVTVGTPVRKAVREAGGRALGRKHLRRWLHIYDSRWDWWQRLGMLFDGHVGGSGKFALPGMQDHGVKGIGHSGVLTDERLIRLWLSNGWLDVHRGEVEESDARVGR